MRKLSVRHRLGASAILAACLFTFSSAQQNASTSSPQTPKQVQAEKQHQSDIQSDIDVGKRAAEETEKEVKLSTNPQYQARVQRIGAEIAAIADANRVVALWGDKRLNPFDYTYKVIQGNDVNAFSLPGGHVYVYEGLMKLVESDDELAGVLAHETAHAALRHVAQLEKDESRLMNLSIPAILAAILLGRGGAANVALPGVQLMQQAQVSGWSIKAEEAADYGGLQYLEKSRYNPTGMLTFMERLAVDEKLGANIDWGIYRDHPPGRERAESLLHYMQVANIPIQRSKVTTSFRVTAHAVNDQKATLEFGTRQVAEFYGPDALSRAERLVPAMNDFFDAAPEMFDLQEGPDGAILWKSKVLLQLSPDDAAASGTRLSALQDITLKNIQTAIFSLGFHVWASHE